MYIDPQRKEDFEKGRECSSLERQISNLDREINCGIGKDNPFDRNRLREILKGAFDRYMNLALTYDFSGEQIIAVGQHYKSGMGIKEIPVNREPVDAEDIPF